MAVDAAVEDVWRRETPYVVAAVARRYGDFDGAEEATQEALLAAARQWPQEGMPEYPRGWLIRVASRRLIDQRRSDSARLEREVADVARQPSDAQVAPAADEAPGPDGDEDDTLQVLLLCCHQVLTASSQVALTLRAVAGLTTAQIAAAFLVPEATMAQRISRAKSTLRTSGARFSTPTPGELPARLAAVMQVLYLVFNEGYAASSGRALLDVSLTQEAVRLARLLYAARPADDEAAGLLALMLLTDARRAARADSDGELVPLERQDRTQWDPANIAEGVAIVESVLPRGEVGPFQLQAAIAAAHDEASTYADTDWLQITMLYRMLDRVAPGPSVTMGLAVAAGMAHGPHAGLQVLQPLLTQPALARNHRLHAVRAHLLEMAGARTEAVESYLRASRLTGSIPEQRYLNGRAAAAQERGRLS